MKQTSLISIGVWLVLVACSEFYPSFVSHGEPVAPGDTVRDTINIPWDSILVDPLLPVNDTVLLGRFTFRAGRQVSIGFTPNDSAGLDSVVLYGAIVCEDTLDVFLAQGAAVAKAIDGALEFAAERLNFTFQIPIITGLHTQLQWDWQSSNAADTLETSILLLAGYSHADSTTLAVPRNVKLVEQVVRSRRVNTALESEEHAWVDLSPLPGDSLQITTELAGGLDAYLLTQEQMDEFLFTAEPPQNALWQSSRDGANYKALVSRAERWTYLVSNTGRSVGTIADSVVLYRRFTVEGP